MLYLTSSGLYKDLLKYNRNKDKIKEEFNKKIKELNFEDENKVNYFLENYKTISYDENNLNKYINLLKFLGTILQKMLSVIYLKNIFMILLIILLLTINDKINIVDVGI
jgi:hypothetical protein